MQVAQVKDGQVGKDHAIGKVSFRKFGYPKLDGLETSRVNRF